MQTQPLPGFRDFYPADLAFRNYIFECWRRVCARYRFEEFDGPPLEPLELYTAKSGEEIVGQLYNFTDKGGREVSLRPELTPTVARMVAARAGGMKKPIRWFSIGQMYRYERQQKGRLREFYQLNCDLIGEPGFLADAEIVALAIDLMRGFGLGPSDVRVRLSDRRVLTSYLRKHPQFEGERIRIAFDALDKIDRVPREKTISRLEEAAFDPAAIERVLAVPQLRDETSLAAALEECPDGPEAFKALKSVLASLEAMRLREFVDLDLTVVRGLLYYTGTVFELFDAGRTLRALAGGGRYDTLLQQLGGVDLPAAGFAIGDVVLGELLKERGLAPAMAAPIDAFVAGVTEDDLPYVLHVAHDLREQQLRVEYALRADGLGKQLKLADARQAQFAVVIGPDDRARGEVQLKALTAKTQRAVPASALSEELKKMLVGRVHDSVKDSGASSGSATRRP